MSILSNESRALLKRMDCDEALPAAVNLGLEAAAKWHEEIAADCEKVGRINRAIFHRTSAMHIRALKTKEAA